MKKSPSIFLPFSEKPSKKDKMEIFYSEESSEEILDAAKESAIFVHCSVKSGKVILSINSTQRPDVTELSSEEDQGDHVTSYASFIAAIVNSSDQLNVAKVPIILRKIAKAILPNKASEIDKISKASPHNRNMRKDLTATLRFAEENKEKILKSIENLKADDPLKKITLATLGFSGHREEFKSDLKDGSLAKYAEEIKELSEFFLEMIQQEEKTSYPSKGRMNKDKAEGARIKETIHALSAVNMLYRVIDILKSEEVDDEEKNNLITDFIEKLQENLGDIKLGFNKIYRNIGKTKDEAAKSTDTLSKNLGERINEAQELLKEVDDLLIPYANTISDLFINLLDLHRELNFAKNNKTRTETKDVEDLYNLTSRHIVVMFTAFNSIAKHFDEKTNELIIENFLELVIKKQGWKDCPELGKTEEQQLNNLREKVNLRIEKSDSDYRLKSAEKVIKAEEELTKKKADEEEAKKKKPKNSVKKPKAVGLKNSGQEKQI